MSALKRSCVLAAILLAVAGCSTERDSVGSAGPQASVGSTRAPALQEGAITPGRYTYTLRVECDDPRVGCDLKASPPPPLDIEVTVPDGWQASLEFGLIAPNTASWTEGPDGAGLVMGWTTAWVGLSSNPCLRVSHQTPDVKVGPSVDDFVEAVVAQPALDVTEPTDVELGGHRGRFFSLKAPKDISGCYEWRPWEPGFFAQGPANIWNVWVMDVSGFRVLVVTQHFPGTSEKTQAALRAMAESVRFHPSKA